MKKKKFLFTLLGVGVLMTALFVANLSCFTSNSMTVFELNKAQAQFNVNEQDYFGEICCDVIGFAEYVNPGIFIPAGPYDVISCRLVQYVNEEGEDIAKIDQGYCTAESCGYYEFHNNRCDYY